MFQREREEARARVGSNYLSGLPTKYTLLERNQNGEGDGPLHLETSLAHTRPPGSGSELDTNVIRFSRTEADSHSTCKTKKIIKKIKKKCRHTRSENQLGVLDSAGKFPIPFKPYL